MRRKRAKDMVRRTEGRALDVGPYSSTPSKIGDPECAYRSSDMSFHQTHYFSFALLLQGLSDNMQGLWASPTCAKMLTARQTLGVCSVITTVFDARHVNNSAFTSWCIHPSTCYRLQGSMMCLNRPKVAPRPPDSYGSQRGRRPPPSLEVGVIALPTQVYSTNRLEAHASEEQQQKSKVLCVYRIRSWPVAITYLLHRPWPCAVLKVLHNQRLHCHLNI